MTRAADALREAARRIAEVSDTPRLDAELLMAHAAGITREALLLDLRETKAPAGFDALVERRLDAEPVAYIVGARDFWTVRIMVGPGVLVPRADSETLIEAAIDCFDGNSEGAGPKRILDLGCGPGTLLLAALDQFPGAEGVGLERSPVACGYAEENARILGMADRAAIVAGDWTMPRWSRDLGGPFDLVLCNPPYIEDAAALMREVAEHEPAEALYSGAEGLDDYRRIIPELPRLVAERGCAILELGQAQAGAVDAIAREAGLTGSLRKDLAGAERAIVLRPGPAKSGAKPPG